MDREKTFAQVVGRAPTATEKLYLQRLGGAWDIRGNDALLAVLFVFCSGAARYQSYAARCCESVRRAVKRQVAAAGSKTAAQPRDDARLEISVTMIATGLVCIAMAGVVGIALGASTTIRLNVPAAVLPLLTTACGWAMFGAVLLPAANGALKGLSLARNGATDQRTRTVGWAMFAAVNVAMGGWVVMLLAL